MPVRELIDPFTFPALKPEYVLAEPAGGLPDPLGHPPRILLLYGSLRERSFSRLAVEEAARLLTLFGAETRIFDPSNLPLPDQIKGDDHPAVRELRELSIKPLTESRGEVAYAASFVEFYAEEAKRIYGETIPSPFPNSRIIIAKQPAGVCAAITPWNFPAAMITRKCSPGLAAGCTFVVKPAPDTPLTALALVELAERAGFPKGVLNIVTGDAKAIGGVMTSHPAVRFVGFTGSTPVGKLLMQQAASTVKKVGLELGGNAPFIVFDDADIDAAVQGAIIAKYRNMGQTCVCTNRLFVQDGIHDEFVAKFAGEVAKMKVGNGVEVGVVQGPLINQNAIDKVERHVADAVAHGAKVVVGGKRHALGRTFYEPTVLSGVTTKMLVTNEETFGPVAPVYRFSSEDEVVAMANDTPFGLAAYFYSKDLGRAFRVAEELEYGMVGINSAILGTEVAPFGGVKESGLGREGSLYGMDEFIEIKYMLMGGLGV